MPWFVYGVGLLAWAFSFWLPFGLAYLDVCSKCPAYRRLRSDLCLSCVAFLFLSVLLVFAAACFRFVHGRSLLFAIPWERTVCLVVFVAVCIRLRPLHRLSGISSVLLRSKRSGNYTYKLQPAEYLSATSEWETHFVGSSSAAYAASVEDRFAVILCCGKLACDRMLGDASYGIPPWGRPQPETLLPAKCRSMSSWLGG